MQRDYRREGCGPWWRIQRSGEQRCDEEIFKELIRMPHAHFYRQVMKGRAKTQKNIN